MFLRNQEFQCQPRRHREGDGERDQHAQARVDRDRAHVRAHQAAHEGHGQQRADDGEGGEDGRAAHLVDRRRDHLRESRMRRWMFSTTTIASSTRMPIEKMSAKSETRFSVKPQAQEAKSVAARVSSTAAPTISASRAPRAKKTSATTESVAKTSFR